MLINLLQSTTDTYIQQGLNLLQELPSLAYELQFELLVLQKYSKVRSF
jgi:hypothetical protein